YLNYPLDNAGRSACVSDLGELAADLRLHEEDGPREAAGGNPAVNSGRRSLAGAGRPEGDHRTGLSRKVRRIDGAILIQNDGLTRARGVGGEDAADSGYHGRGKWRGHQ